MKRLLAAISLLTIFPVPGTIRTSDIERCKSFFPVVGLALGGIAWLLAFLLDMVVPQAVSAVAMTIVMTMFSGAFHLDGLTDTADGFMSARSREKMLQIMSDSRIGVMGAFVMCSTLMLKAAILFSLPPAIFPAAIMTAVLSGRCSIVIYTCFSRYAKSDGLGKVMFIHRSPLLCVVTVIIISLNAFLWFGLGGLSTAAVVILFAILWSRYTKYKIGGATGDTIGACVELSELLVLFTVCLFACAS